MKSFFVLFLAVFLVIFFSACAAVSQVESQPFDQEEPKPSSVLLEWDSSVDYFFCNVDRSWSVRFCRDSEDILAVFHNDEFIDFVVPGENCYNGTCFYVDYETDPRGAWISY